jgi:kynurenine formamidase
MAPEPSVSPADRERIAAYQAQRGRPSTSPFGPDDEIGMLNVLTPDLRRSIINEADAATVFDLSVDFFMGMPVWQEFGDPPFQICLTHTPAGTGVDFREGLGPEPTGGISYTGDAVSFYTHCGTHIDALCHWGYHGEIWNHFTAEVHLGSRHWHRAGADRQPPIVARGVLIDVAAAKGVPCLPDSYGITADDIHETLRRQKTQLRVGDVPLIRTGRMTAWPDPQGYLANSPGITMDAAKLLAESGAALIGADNVALEKVPADPEEPSWTPVHTYLIAECGVAILEIADLEAISQEQIYEFAFVAATIRVRGATGAPVRPIAMPLR